MKIACLIKNHTTESCHGFWLLQHRTMMQRVLIVIAYVSVVRNSAVFGDDHQCDNYKTTYLLSSLHDPIRKS